MELRKGKLLHESKTKKIYSTSTEGLLILNFKDEICFYDTEESFPVKNKGKNNASISTSLFRLLDNYHIGTYFVQVLKGNELVVREMEMIPLETVVWNYASSSFCKRYGIEKGKALEYPVIEYYWKNEKINKPMLGTDHLIAFSLTTEPEIRIIDGISRKVNAVLKSFFERRNLVLADFKLEFGRSSKGIDVGDEISLDTCRLWDMRDGQIDINRFRLDRGQVQNTYMELFERVGIKII